MFVLHVHARPVPFTWAGRFPLSRHRVVYKGVTLNVCSPDKKTAGDRSAFGAFACDARGLSALKSRAAIGGFLLLLLMAMSARPAQVFADSMQERVQASWYGTTAHGKTTANGETFNRYNLTVAHKQLPFGIVLRIKNLNNGRQVLARVNDRGPYIPGRSLDVSHRAAIALRMVDLGVAPVNYEIISDRRGVPLNKENAFYVHIINVNDSSKAKLRAQKLADEYQCSISIIPTANGKSTTHALCIGPFKNFRKAQSEFMKRDKESATLRGIIEGPARPGEKVAKAPAGKKIKESAPAPMEQQVAATAMPDLGESAAQALCSPALQKSFGLLDMALGPFFGIHSQQPALSLHYSVLSNCPDVSL